MVVLTLLMMLLSMKTRNKRSFRLILHFIKPVCVNDQAWISDDRAVQLNDNDSDVTFEESPVEVELVIKK